MRAFGYALYGVGTEPYDGPPPVEAPTGGIGPPALPVLKLLEISGYNMITDSGYQHTPGAPGFSRTNESRYAEGYLMGTVTDSARLTGLPLEIRLGEPVQVGADAARSIAWAPDGQCEIFSGASVGLHARNHGGSASARGVFKSTVLRQMIPRTRVFSEDERPTGGGSVASR